MDTNEQYIKLLLEFEQLLHNGKDYPSDEEMFRKNIEEFKRLHSIDFLRKAIENKKKLMQK